MWELDRKEVWELKDWCFWTVVLEKTLESPLGSKEIKPVNPKGNQSRIFIGKTDAEAEAPILWPPDANNWLIGKDSAAEQDGEGNGNSLQCSCLENPRDREAWWAAQSQTWLTWLSSSSSWARLKAGGEGDNRGWDGWMASPTQWTWVWASSGSWWWTGKAGVLQFMGSQRVGHDWLTELNWDTFLEKQRKNNLNIWNIGTNGGHSQKDPSDAAIRRVIAFSSIRLWNGLWPWETSREK